MKLDTNSIFTVQLSFIINKYASAGCLDMYFLDMYFNVAQLLKEACGSSRTYQISDFARLADATSLTAVSGSVRMMRTDAGMWVSAELWAHLDCVCSRCVADMEHMVSVAIEEEYLPEIDVSTGTRLRPTICQSSST